MSREIRKIIIEYLKGSKLSLENYSSEPEEENNWILVFDNTFDQESFKKSTSLSIVEKKKNL